MASAVPAAIVTADLAGGRRRSPAAPTASIDSETSMTTKAVDGCARCGGSHPNLEFRRFTGEPNPHYTHWALCPKTGHPILLVIALFVDDNRIGQLDADSAELVP